VLLPACGVSTVEVHPANTTAASTIVMAATAKSLWFMMILRYWFRRLLQQGDYNIERMEMVKYLT
jgi:hypothetical protein